MVVKINSKNDEESERDGAHFPRSLELFLNELWNEYIISLNYSITILYIAVCIARCTLYCYPLVIHFC